MSDNKRRLKQTISALGLTVPYAIVPLRLDLCLTTSQAAELASTRESLVAAEVSQKHLQSRADELSKQLQVLQEKLLVYERRPSGHAASATTISAATGDVDVDQLRGEVAELSATLKATQVDLERAKIDVAQYQAISQASETTLSEMIATHDLEKKSSEEFVTSLQVSHDAQTVWQPNLICVYLGRT